MRIKDQIIGLLLERRSIGYICKNLNCSKGTVSYHKKKMGQTIKSTPRYNWAEIRAYQLSGKSIKECKEKFGCSHSSWTTASKKGLVKGKEALPTNPFCKCSRRRNASFLRKSLLARGILEYKCYGPHCLIDKGEWLGKPLILQLDHIDGDGTNNEISNLRLLCPNCHSQTDTWAFRNKDFYKNKYGS